MPRKTDKKTPAKKTAAAKKPAKKTTKKVTEKKVTATKAKTTKKTETKKTATKAKSATKTPAKTKSTTKAKTPAKTAAKKTTTVKETKKPAAKKASTKSKAAEEKKTTKSKDNNSDRIKSTQEFNDSKKTQDKEDKAGAVQLDEKLAPIYKKLLLLGKQKGGFLTIEEVNSVLPKKHIATEQIDTLVGLISEAGITVSDQEMDDDMLDINVEQDDDDNASTEEETTSSEDTLSRTDDPVRLYLREMGNVELLSREGEVEIAKRIESGRETMISALCESPLAMRDFITWYNNLSAGEMLLRDIIDLDAMYNAEVEAMIAGGMTPEQIQAETNKKAQEIAEKEAAKKREEREKEKAELGELEEDEEFEDEDEEGRENVTAFFLSPLLLCSCVLFFS